MDDIDKINGIFLDKKKSHLGHSSILHGQRDEKLDVVLRQWCAPWFLRIFLHRSEFDLSILVPPIVNDILSK